ncbi:SGNH/GDSL hydrolase family protein [Parasulfitobacter algicola]|uniref:SGNH/GDSL hydrolase family protein n=1 Tax=Parasulfitobacter algicola TaxID=2614809 RepID=A0ABX2IMX8_9RHOB|nr:SGNH/GDSL hydrolase family protein [Sulfitobacter algicola]NSX54241.1 SGNH/GDSL hydrolase family protein [Sulfitobacter algicola]
MYHQPVMQFAIYLISHIVLLPVLAFQAVQVRKKALVLPEPAGERRGTIGRGLQLKMLILGDSSAAGVGVEHQDQALAGLVTRHLAAGYTVEWQLVAKTGATTASTLRHLQAQPAMVFDVIVVSLGVNDVTSGVSLKKWLQNYTALMDFLAFEYEAKRIYVSGLPPLGSFPLLPHPLRWVLGRQAVKFDHHLQTIIESRTDCSYISLSFPMDPDLMASDGFHPGPRAYQVWAQLVVQQIKSESTLSPAGSARSMLQRPRR